MHSGALHSQSGAMAVSWASNAEMGGDHEQVEQEEDARSHSRSNYDDHDDMGEESKGDIFEQDDSHVRFSEGESEQEHGNILRLGFIHEGNTYAVSLPPAITSASKGRGSGSSGSREEEDLRGVTAVEAMGLDPHFVIGAQVVGTELQVWQCSIPAPRRNRAHPDPEAYPTSSSS